MRIDIEKRFSASGSCSLQGETVDFQAVTERITFFDDSGEAEATAHTIAYIRENTDGSPRPVLFAYNGGPGSSSSTIHIGALAPWRVKIDDSISLNFTPPYEMEDNPDTILDICDVVIIDPVGCGFSRLLKKDAASKYYNTEGDTQSIVQIINKWICAHKRWNCPLFIMGESYGTIRNALVAEKLFYSDSPALSNCCMLQLSGIIMLGTALDHGQTPLPVDTTVLNFTSIAATYWLHHQEGKPSLEEFVAEASEFAYREYLPALALGKGISDEEREKVIARLTYFTGMERDALLTANLRVETSTYPLLGMKKEGYRVSRYDGRVKMPPMEDISNYDMFGDDAISSKCMPAINHCFNGFVLEKLGIDTNELYEFLTNEAGYHWDFKTAKPPVKSLENAMRKNQELHVMFGNGYYDMVTTPGFTEYLINAFDLPRERVVLKLYESGHMPYLGASAAARFGKDLRKFILGAFH